MASVFNELQSCGIKKKLLHAGRGPLSEFKDGTKIAFHYHAKRCDEEQTTLDSSKKDGGKPMELYMGKKFKLEVWEMCLKTMRADEVASFTVEPELLVSYPLVAKSLREIRQGKHLEQKSSHCCGLAMKEHGTGYPDLDALLKNPEPLEFIFEMVKIEEPGEFKKEAWALDENEKIAAIPRLKEEGNALYMARNYKEAAEKYGEAIGHLEQLLLREKPGDDPWVELDQKKIPLLLNYSQCQLLLEDYYPVIEHTTEVLKKDPDNVKALFRRAKAHGAVWNLKEAREDYQRVVELDSSLAKGVQKELTTLAEKEKEKDREERAKLQGKIFT